ncbi:CBL-interacting serine/threonine-protein kinase 14 [Phoenix dactylifera]|uniref:non-specific serine/threonine protein kinase n=1 Tax=Phoenix dactylifera TaxID=42345 RepID=A0A8B7D0N8_PHODC|nr:CBL-interacting serine/threonine-protein kinase 14 [Phoenix dactylifera]
MPVSGGCVPPDGGGEAPPSAAKVLFGKYEVGRLLGCGAFARVYHARTAGTGQSVAIKCISKHKVLRGGLAGNVRREIAAMRRLRHPHIVRLYEVLASRTKIYFVLELAKGGELFARISAHGRLPEDAARRLFQQLVSAVAFCHARGVFHRDLKPENLLLDDQGDLKVSDFGLSAVVSTANGDRLFQTLCGTPAYVAPEILSKRGYDGAKVDIWSCGVILFVLAAGYLPFNDPNLMNLYRKIYRGDFRCPRWISPELRRLLGRLLDTNPETRLTVEGIVADPWFRTGLEEDRFLAMTRFREDIDARISKRGQLPAAWTEEGGEEERELNAFDIISFSTGFDLSGLFDAAADRERFVSGQPPEVILGRVEEVGRAEELVVRRRKGKPGGGGGGAAVEDRTGNMVVWVEVYRLNRELVLVEVEIGREGEGNWEFWREKLGPGLKCGSVSEPQTPVSCSSGWSSDRVSSIDSWDETDSN